MNVDFQENEVMPLLHGALQILKLLLLYTRSAAIIVKLIISCFYFPICVCIYKYLFYYSDSSTYT